jgi:hypothetical protein
MSDAAGTLEADREAAIIRAQLPPRDHGSLVLAAWIHRDTPPRDYLLGGVLCTTSRWFVIGETGVGKTLFGAELGASCAKGVGFLNWAWAAGCPCRVMYIDGECPSRRSRSVCSLSPPGTAPTFSFTATTASILATPECRHSIRCWAKHGFGEKSTSSSPDLVIFDSIMCLLVGPMQDEATWAPMKPLVCELSAKRIAQVWFNHANDLGKSFGDKTREWEMDTVAKLSKAEGDEAAIRLEFSKARLRTPKTAGQFAPLIIRPSEDWRFEIAKAGVVGKQGGDVEMIRDELIKAYDHLADGVTKSFGLDDRSSVLKVPVASIREELKDRGLLDLDDKGNIERVSRNHFSRAKKLLLVRRGGAPLFVERKGQIWRL